MRYLTPLAIVLVFVAVIPVKAQTDRAILQEIITDQSGATVPAAQALQPPKSIPESATRLNPTGTAITWFPVSLSGLIPFPSRRPDSPTKVISDVILRVGEGHALDVGLELGAISQRVDVQAQVNPAEHTSAADASVITNQEIAPLPVNGRDWSELTILAPFAQDDGGGDQRTIRFAGRARDDNNFSIDGVDAGGIQEQAQKSSVRLQISEDAVDEYRVNSALYDTEYGTQSGGQVNVVTKSGTNDFHGTVFGYLRNSVFDARDFNDFDAAGKTW